MKEMSLWIWLTQLGLSVAVPPVGFVLLALWLRDSCGWGGWVIWIGVILGIYSAIESLRASLKAVSVLSGDERKKEPPICFNDHE